MKVLKRVLKVVYETIQPGISQTFIFLRVCIKHDVVMYFLYIILYFLYCIVSDLQCCVLIFR